MKMKDWAKELDLMLKSNKYEVLKDKGSVSNEEAKEFAESEYDKFRVIQDRQYISEFDKIIEDVKRKKE